MRQQDEEQVVTKSLYHTASTRQIDLLILDRLNPIVSNKVKIFSLDSCTILNFKEGETTKFRNNNECKITPFWMEATPSINIRGLSLKYLFAHQEYAYGCYIPKKKIAGDDPSSKVTLSVYLTGLFTQILPAASALLISARIP